MGGHRRCVQQLTHAGRVHAGTGVGERLRYQLSDNGHQHTHTAMDVGVLFPQLSAVSAMVGNRLIRRGHCRGGVAACLVIEAGEIARANSAGAEAGLPKFHVDRQRAFPRVDE